ncbi:ferritin-like domain-containing protein [Iamia sp.]|uniref:ferritin-like domain-containing protein n=1 Tax=Iamia sp. TaxID=2722710 RepID=UPI002B86AA3A|nr:ferritin-like domain-containing protein [Iamia sp.]HXH56021.1 ferritin-like domain-containing protein [Iamia sp.]
MSIDDRRLGELIVESQDLHTDAMRDARSTLPDIKELGAERRSVPVDPDRVAAMNSDRRRLLRNGGLGVGALAARGLIGSAFGSAIVGTLARPIAAQTEADVDVQIFQTASSLEILAVNTYAAALELDFIANGNEVVKTFAEMTMSQHDEHRVAFQNMSEELGGEMQTEPNPKYMTVVEDATPGLTDPMAVVELAATLEEVAGDTYLANLSLLSDGEMRLLMGSVMGVECQHLATLRAVGALLEGGAEELIAIPTDPAALPAAAGSVAFPSAFESPDMASPPEEGAVA